LPLPVYTIVTIVGEGHEQIFTAECVIDTLSQSVVRGKGGSRRKAEQEAAATMLERLGVDKTQS